MWRIMERFWMTGSVLGKKKTIKLWLFSRCGTVYIKQTSKNSQHNIFVFPTPTLSCSIRTYMYESVRSECVKIIQSVFFKETINSNNYVQLIITPYSREFKEEKQHGHIMHEKATTNSAILEWLHLKIPQEKSL